MNCFFSSGFANEFRWLACVGDCNNCFGGLCDFGSWNFFSLEILQKKTGRRLSLICVFLLTPSKLEKLKIMFCWNYKTSILLKNQFPLIFFYVDLSMFLILPKPTTAFVWRQFDFTHIFQTVLKVKPDFKFINF